MMATCSITMPRNISLPWMLTIILLITGAMQPQLAIITLMPGKCYGGIGRFESQYNNPQGIDHYKNVSLQQNYSEKVYGNSFSHNHNFNITSGNEKNKNTSYPLITLVMMEQK